MLVFLLAVAGTAISMPIVLQRLQRAAILDVPSGRSSHAAPTVRGIGIACLIGLMVAGIAAVPNLHWRMAVAVLLAGAFSGVGLLDDILSLPALPRLLLQTLLGATIGLTFTGEWITAVVGAGLGVLCVNTVNFMDGINGITGAVMLSWGCLGSLTAARTTDENLLAVCLIVAGIALGFLPWNWGNARGFLGDVGSYLFGAMVTVGLLWAWVESYPIVPVLVAPLYVYFADVLFTLVRKMVGGQNLLNAHRNHVYQRLVNTYGWSHSIVSFLVAAVAVTIGVLWMTLPSSWSALASSAIIGAYLLLPSALKVRGGQSRGMDYEN